MVRKSSQIATLTALLVAALPFASSGSARGREASEQQNRKTAPNPATVIDINRASAEDFQKLPGIGPGLAGRIVAFRQKHGPFRRVEDLLAIRGIGPKKWRRMRPYLRIGGSGGKSEIRRQKSEVRSQEEEAGKDG